MPGRSGKAVRPCSAKGGSLVGEADIGRVVTYDVILAGGGNPDLRLLPGWNVLA